MVWMLPHGSRCVNTDIDALILSVDDEGMAETKTIDLGPTGHTVRRNIERLRKAQGLSYAELSRKLGELGRPIPALGLRRIEAAQRRVDTDDLVALAIALRANPNMLLFPPLRSRGVWTGVTGIDGEVSTTAAWTWADGRAPVKGLDPEADEYPLPGYGATLQPIEVLTPEERRERRERWRDSQVAELERDLRGVTEEGEMLDIGGDIVIGRDEGYTERWIEETRSEIAQLRAMDPADDSAWSAVGFDPGREWAPSAEMLEGLRFDG